MRPQLGTSAEEWIDLLTIEEVIEWLEKRGYDPVVSMK